MTPAIPASQARKVAVVGGGISGLAAALRLAEARAAGRPLEQHLFEAAPRLGGVILSDSAEGCVVEAGPGSFLTEKPQALDLARQLGIAGDIIGSNDRAQWFKSSNHSINRSFNPLRR